MLIKCVNKTPQKGDLSQKDRNINDWNKERRDCNSRIFWARQWGRGNGSKEWGYLSLGEVNLLIIFLFKIWVQLKIAGLVAVFGCIITIMTVPAMLQRTTTTSTTTTTEFLSSETMTTTSTSTIDCDNYNFTTITKSITTTHAATSTAIQIITNPCFEYDCGNSICFPIDDKPHCFKEATIGFLTYDRNVISITVVTLVSVPQIWPIFGDSRARFHPV